MSIREFASHLGLDSIVGMETAFVSDFPTLNQLMAVIPKNQFCVIGGGAVVAHVGKNARKISPDIDLMVDPGVIALLKGKGFELKKNTHGFSVDSEVLGIDLIVANRKYERTAIAKSTIHNIGGMKLPVISVPFLILMKMLAGRTKDMKDVVLLFKKHPTSLVEVVRMMKIVKPDMVDDVESVYFESTL